MRSRSRNGAARRPVPRGDGGQMANEAVRLATTHIREAHHLLAPYRDDDSAPELRTAYEAVHSAVSDLAAARHWVALESRLAGAEVVDEDVDEQDAG